MTKERAKHILSNALPGGDLRYAFARSYSPFSRLYTDGLTREEDRAVKALWETMPGWTTYSDALWRIARGEA